MKKLTMLVFFLGLSSFIFTQKFPLDTSGVVPGGNAYFMYGNQVPTGCTMSNDRTITCPNNIRLIGVLLLPTTSGLATNLLGVVHVTPSEAANFYLNPASRLNTQPVTIGGRSYPSIITSANCLVPGPLPIAGPSIICNDGTSYSTEVGIVNGSHGGLKLYQNLPTTYPGGKYLGSAQQPGTRIPTYYFWVSIQ